MSDNIRIARKGDDEQPIGLAKYMRRLPHNVDAEMALLGGLLMDNKVFDHIPSVLKPDDFSLKEHSRIFNACLQMRDRGKKVDPVTMKEFFHTEETLAHVGIAYLTKLCECSAPPKTAGQYGREVHELSLKRQMIALCEGAMDSAYSDTDEDVSKHIDKLQESLFSLGNGSPETGFMQVGHLAGDVFAESRRALARRTAGIQNGIKTGFADLDRIIGAFRKSQCIFLAGRPSMGKTTLACNLAYNIAASFRREHADPATGKPEEVLSGGRVAFISLENDRGEIVRQNFASIACRISGEKLLDPDPNEITEADIDAAEKMATEKLARMPIAICDGINGLNGIRKALREEMRRNGLSVAIVDYMGLVEGTSDPKAGMYQIATQLSNGFKRLAKELKIPIIILCQLSRSLEQRENKRPILSDLRESGHIEQDGDVVMFVYRHEYYLKDQEPPEKHREKHAEWMDQMADAHGKMEVIVAKCRMGRIGKATLHYDPELAFVGNLDRRCGY